MERRATIDSILNYGGYVINDKRQTPNIYELTPRYDSRASFYGKAHVIEYPDGTKQLKSYNTTVCEISPDGIFRPLWDGRTQTTSRHIKEFRKQFDPTF